MSAGKSRGPRPEVRRRDVPPSTGTTNHTVERTVGDEKIPKEGDGTESESEIKKPWQKGGGKPNVIQASVPNHTTGELDVVWGGKQIKKDTSVMEGCERHGTGKNILPRIAHELVRASRKGRKGTARISSNVTRSSKGTRPGQEKKKEARRRNKKKRRQGSGIKDFGNRKRWAPAMGGERTTNHRKGG